MIPTTTNGEADQLDDLLDLVDALLLDPKHDFWPSIKISDDMKVIGQGTPRMKRICKAIRINEKEINNITRKWQKMDDNEGKDEFYTQFVQPLEERGFRLMSLLEFVIRLEFDEVLMDHNPDATVGIGSGGKVFYVTISPSTFYGLYNSKTETRLYKPPV